MAVAEAFAAAAAAADDDDAGDVDNSRLWSPVRLSGWDRILLEDYAVFRRDSPGLELVVLVIPAPVDGVGCRRIDRVFAVKGMQDILLGQPVAEDTMTIQRRKWKRRVQSVAPSSLLESHQRTRGRR